MRYVVYHGQWVVCARFHGNNSSAQPLYPNIISKTAKAYESGWRIVLEELQQGMSLTVQNLPALQQVADATETHTIMWSRIESMGKWAN